MFACEVREGSVTRQVKTLDNVGQFIMKKPRRLGRRRGFSVLATGKVNHCPIGRAEPAEMYRAPTPGLCFYRWELLFRRAGVGGRVPHPASFIAVGLCLGHSHVASKSC